MNRFLKYRFVSLLLLSSGLLSCSEEDNSYVLLPDNDIQELTQSLPDSLKNDLLVLELINERWSWRHQIWGKIKTKRKALFIGDSVTQSYVVEGTQDNPKSVYTDQIEDFFRYPYAFGHIFPEIEITIKARSGIKTSQWIKEYSDVDFSQYDLIIIELGLNGSLSIADLYVGESETYYYVQLLRNIRTQNENADLCLVASQHFWANDAGVLRQLGEGYNCKIIDLHDREFGDLDLPQYHGYYTNELIDHAHFTRKGYNMKAYVVAKMIDKQLNISK